MSSTSSPFGQNEWLVEEMYRKFRDDPSSVDESWHEFLVDYNPEAAEATGLPVTDPTEAVRAGNPDGALPFLMRVLQSDPSALASTNGVTFRPARTLAIDAIRALPEGTLATYRRQAAFLAKNPAGPLAKTLDVTALEALYQGALPGGGNVVGLRLAALYLDQERFLDARRVLLYFHGGGYCFCSMHSHRKLVGHREPRLHGFQAQDRVGEGLQPG